MLAEEHIQKVIEKMEIAEVVGDFLKLKRKGSNLVANCPFHNEKSGSFSVSKSRQIYKCFGCGKSGNAITFVMEHEKVAYPDAIKWLAQKYSIPITEIFKNDEEKAKATKIESLYLLNKFAQEFFKESLAESAVAKEYLAKRNLDTETADFGIGYSGAHRSALANRIIAARYSQDIAVSAGIIKKRDDGSYYDFFFDRICFPIHSISGKIVGFTARIVDNNSQLSKYINTAENEVFHKGSILYGLFQAKQFIAKSDEAILVEGQTDVIMMHKFGLKNTIASSGTALTKDMLRLLKRFTSNIVFFLDGDNAGGKATKSGVELAIEEGFSIKICFLPKDEDPDSFCRSKGGDFVREYIEKNKREIVDYLCDTQDMSTPDKKDALFQEVCRLIGKIADLGNVFRKKHHVEVAARRFGLQEFQVNNAIGAIMGASNTSGGTNSPVEQKQANREPIIHRREKEMTRLLLKFGHLEYLEGKMVFQHILETVNLEEKEDYYTTNSLTMAIHSQYLEKLQDGEMLTIYDFMRNEDKDICSFATSTAIGTDQFSANWNVTSSPDEDYRKEIHIASGMYLISYYKMNWWMLHNNPTIKNDPEWTAELVAKADVDLKGLVMDIVKKLGLVNFKF